MGLAQSIDRITVIIVIVAVIVAVIAAGGIGYYWYYTRVLMKKRKKVEEVDYSTFDKRDATTYLGFDDIRNDMIVTDNGRRFIGVIACRGFDLYSAHVAEQYNAQSGYRAFINTISEPISYRQYTTQVNMGHTLENYKENLDRVTTQLFNMTAEYKEMERNLKDMQKQLQEKLGEEKALEDEGFNTLLDSMVELKKQIDNMDWRRFHIEDQIAYIEQISGVDAAPSPAETYVFEWVYNPLAFPMELTNEEIEERAQQELDKRAHAKIHALSGAGVKARRCTTNELIEMCRRHCCPISSERYRMEDVEDSTFFEDITGTTAENELEEAYMAENEQNLKIAVASALDNIEIEIPTMEMERKDETAEGQTVTQEVSEEEDGPVDVSVLETEKERPVEGVDSLSFDLGKEE